MKLEFIHPADQELKDACFYYEEQVSGLGDRFINKFKNTIKIVLEHPLLWEKEQEGL